MTVIGIDYSLSCPCICFLGENATFTDSKFLYMTDTKKYLGEHNNLYGLPHLDWTQEMERYSNIAGRFLMHILLVDRPTVYIEGYSMNSKGKVYQIHENTSVLKLSLYQSQINYDSVPPTSVKKFATGKGNATKEVMYKHFLDQGNPDIREWLGLEKKEKIGNPISDIVDSYYVALLGKELIDAYEPVLHPEVPNRRGKGK